MKDFSGQGGVAKLLQGDDEIYHDIESFIQGGFSYKSSKYVNVDLTNNCILEFDMTS